MNIGYVAEFLCEEKIVMTSFQIGNCDTRLSTDPILLTNEQIYRLANRLKDNCSNYWELSFLRAKNADMTCNYYDAIIWINIAFEGFTWGYLKEALSKRLSDAELDDIYGDKPSCDSKEILKYLTNEQLQEIVTKNIIRSGKPGVQSIYKKVCRYTKSNYNKVKPLVNIINKHRNNIVHGRYVPCDNLERDSKDAIVAFTELSCAFGE